jgi:hypothetical protein
MTRQALAIDQPVTADPMLPRPVTIQRVSWETDDTFTLLLDMSTGVDQPHEFQFLPGQFNMLYVFGTGEAAISISSDPAKRKTLAHTIHRVGTVTTAMAQLKRGGTVGLRGPFGSSWPLDVARGRDVCVVAGGIVWPRCVRCCMACSTNALRSGASSCYTVPGRRSISFSAWSWKNGRAGTMLRCL